jgi:hypothetical protein
MDMENKLVETYNDGNFVTFLFLDKKSGNAFYYEFETNASFKNNWIKVFSELNSIAKNKEQNVNKISKKFNNEEELIEYFEENIL